MTKARIGWHSNAPWAGTGYGMQTDLFVPLVQKLGYHVDVSANYGLGGAMLNASGYKVLPVGYDDWGNDILLGHKVYHQWDFTIILGDIWVYDPRILEQGQCYVWCPVDHDPAPPAVIKHAKAAAGVIAMSRFGERKLREAGLTNVWYVPHGVDTEKYKPMDRTEARQRLKLPQDAFVVGMVMANKGAPSRKAFDQQIRAFAQLREQHDDAILWLHTDVTGEMGEDLKRIMALAGLPDDAWRASNQYELRCGVFGSDYMNLLYNAFDVTLNATRGEGFGVPIIESQATGTPVIVTDATAPAELCGGGWKVKPVDKVYTGQASYQFIPSVDEIAAALAEAYSERGDNTRRHKARAFALDYDAQYISMMYWAPVLEDIASRHVNELTPQIQAVEGLPDVSLIIPTKAGGETLAKAIATAMSVKQVAMEVIVVDDNGRETPDQITENLKKLPKQTNGNTLRWVTHVDNEGQVNALITGTMAATGRYIMFHGDDDWVGDGLRDLVAAMDGAPDNVLFGYGSQQYHGERQDVVEPGQFDAERLWHNYYVLNGVIYRRQTFSEHKMMWYQLDGMVYPQDWDLALQIIDRGYVGMRVVTQSPVLHYTLTRGRQWSRMQGQMSDVMAAMRKRWPKMAEGVTA